MPTGEITQLLKRWQDGAEDALGQLTELAYEELRRLARRQKQGNVVQTTALVSEWYLRLAEAGTVRVEDRAHFLALSARVMRQILCTEARRIAAQKRGGGGHAVSLSEVDRMLSTQVDQYLEVEQALERLRNEDAQLADVVDCRFYAGLTEQETSLALGVSLRQVQRLWARARERLLELCA